MDEKLGIFDVVDMNVNVKEIMSSPVLVIGSSEVLKDAARLFISHSISGAPVVDDDGYSVGVLTFQDIVRYTEWYLDIEDSAAYIRNGEMSDRDREAFRAGLHLEKLNQTTVHQIMTPEITSVMEDETVLTAVKSILAHRVHRVFVTNKKTEIVGVISTTDIVRWLSEHTVLKQVII